MALDILNDVSQELHPMDPSRNSGATRFPPTCDGCAVQPICPALRDDS